MSEEKANNTKKRWGKAFSQKAEKKQVAVQDVELPSPGTEKRAAAKASARKPSLKLKEVTAKQRTGSTSDMMLPQQFDMMEDAASGPSQLVEDFSHISMTPGAKTGDGIQDSPVGALNKLTQKLSRDLPCYSITPLTSKQTPPHQREYMCDVKFRKFTEQGFGSSKKSAKNNAAEKMLTRIRQECGFGSMLPCDRNQQQQDLNMPKVKEVDRALENFSTFQNWVVTLSSLLSFDLGRGSGTYESRYLTDFEHEACLGKGGYGVVFRARNKLDRQSYAIKRIALNRSDRAKDKVRREVVALASLEHTNIVRYYHAWFENPPVGWQEEKDLQLEGSFSSIPTQSDFTSYTTSSRMSGNSGRPKQYLYIQMQLCKDSLKERLAQHTLDIDDKKLLVIFKQIVSAVEYVHDAGLIHRDLTPANVFFSFDEVVKVGDFGLVTPLEEQEECGSQENDQGWESHQLTAQVGTTLYMSPEQEARQPYDNKVDIFSLGMILFELFYPFSTQMERIRTLMDAKHQQLPEGFLREHPVVFTLTKQLLSSDPSSRPSTKEILRHQLLEQVESRTRASP